MSMNNPLPTPLPCPFCGSTPHLWDKSDVAYVGCKNKHCPTHPKAGTTAGHTLAIAAWNRRPKPPASVFVIETIGLTVPPATIRINAANLYQVGKNSVNADGVYITINRDISRITLDGSALRLPSAPHHTIPVPSPVPRLRNEGDWMEPLDPGDEVI